MVSPATSPVPAGVRPALTGAARVAGVIGWPIRHSRSPRLHGHWLARHGIDGAYVPLAIAPQALAAAVHGLRLAGFAGLNVTLPHKQAVMALCDRLDPSAARAGAVNTLVFGADGITGSNTDGAGFLANLQAHGARLAGPALLLGAGGGARAIAAALLQAGVAVTIANRTPARAEALAAALPGVRLIGWADRAAALADQALLVNTTQLGMEGQPPLEMSLDRAAPGLAVADIVYAPLVTPLLADAAARGLLTVGGIGMLLHQAVPGFSAWFGVTPVVDRALQDAVLA
ncbi:MAG: shikimate dehydrogenase [Janthinobacterium lividum]